MLDRCDARRLAMLNAAARCALGVTALAAPGLPLTPWVGAARRDTAAKMLARGLGARDLAIGLGTLTAARAAAPLRGWVRTGGIADAGDVVATAAAFGELPRLGRWVVLLAAAGGLVAAGLSAPAVDG